MSYNRHVARSDHHRQPHTEGLREKNAGHLVARLSKEERGTTTSRASGGAMREPTLVLFVLLLLCRRVRRPPAAVKVLGWLRILRIRWWTTSATWATSDRSSSSPPRYDTMTTPPYAWPSSPAFRAITRVHASLLPAAAIHLHLLTLTSCLVALYRSNA